MTPQRFVLVILVLLLFVTGSVGVTDVAGDVSQHGPEPNPFVAVNDSTNPQFGTQTTSTPRQLTELHRLPGTPGKIRVRGEDTIPSGVASLVTHLPTGPERSGTVGFTHKQDTEYRWDVETNKSHISFRLALNQTIATTGPVRRAV